VESGPWRKSLTYRADAAMIRSVMDATDVRRLNTVMPRDKAVGGNLVIKYVFPNGDMSL